MNVNTPLSQPVDRMPMSTKDSTLIRQAVVAAFAAALVAAWREQHGSGSADEVA